MQRGPIHNSSQTGLICLGLWPYLTGTVITQMFVLAVSNESESQNPSEKGFWRGFMDSLHLTGSWPRGGCEMRSGYKVCYSFCCGAQFTQTALMQMEASDAKLKCRLADLLCKTSHLLRNAFLFLL